MSEMKKIRKAVIPAAGLGTRFLPITKCLPKELIPLVDQSCIEHVIDEALAAGVEEFIFVISKEKQLIEDYFKPDERLNSWLTKRNKQEALERLRKIETQATYTFVYQDEPLGLGHAICCAKDHIDDEHFFVILPDDIIASEVPTCQQMMKVFQEVQTAMISVMLVKWEDVHRYGIVKANPLSEDLGEVMDIVEKPKRENSPSNLAVVGRYILPKSIFPYLEKTQPGAGGEIQLTDALRELIANGGLHSYSFEGERYDTGTPLGWLQANFSLALKKEEFQEPLKKLVKLLAASV